MSSPPTMAALQVEQMLMALEACGIRRSLLCRAIGLAPAALRDPEARIASSVPVALFAEAERITGDRLVGLHAGERTIPRGPLVYLLLSHPQIEVGFQQVQRFTALVADGLRIELIRQPRTVSVLIDVGDALAVTPHITDYTMSIVANVFRRVLGVGDLLQEAHVRHEAWDDATEAQRVFGCPVRCGQPQDRLIFGLRLLETRSRLGTELIASAMVKLAESLHREVPLGATCRVRVELVTRRMLARGFRADRATVARELGVSDRTLRARLREEGTTFKAVRDEVVWEVVTTLLANPNLTVEAVALSVGFGDVAAFSNAFKRWAGCAPTTYRERLAGR
jgi:AraC-like DNA-binding protein